MAAVPLPAGIDEKLAELSAEIRRLRVIRGASWLAVFVCLIPLAAIALDSSVKMALWQRLLVFAGWAALGVGAGWYFVLRRMKGEVPPAQLAAAIEAKYPNLSERLRTLVELSEQADPGNGSKAMIGILGRETEKRTQKLNFFRAAPTAVSFRVAALALVVGAVAVVLGFFVRWYTPAVEVAFKVEVSSGDPIVKRGEPVTLTAFLKKTKPTAVLPETATLVFRAPGTTAEKKLPMTGDDKAAFTVTRPKVDGDFEYAVECGTLRTDWHTVFAVDPVAVAAGTTTTITPPEYAKGIEVQKKEGLAESEVLQHGTVAFDLKLDRAATDGRLEWRAEDAKPEQPADTVPLTFAADKQSATATFTAAAKGTLKFVLIGDKGVKTEIPVAVAAAVDLPPRFEKAVGIPIGLRDVKPDRPLKFDIAVTDDVGVASVVVEYAKLTGNVPGPTKTETLALAGIGTKRAEGKVEFLLANKANDREMLQFRVRVTDNRSVPAAGLAPQSVTYPDGAWTILRLNSAAAPIGEQEITAQKEEIDAKLDVLEKKVRAAAKDVAALKKDADGKPKLQADQIVRLDQDREKANDAARDLDDLARQADVTPELRQLARQARDIAADQLRPAGENLRKAGNEADAEKRDGNTAEANKGLEAALERIADLKKKNAEAAKNRMARENLNDLAADQQRLADEAAKAAAEKAADLAAKQKELRDRLDKLMKDNPVLKDAADAAVKKEAAELAEELRRLRQKQQDLDAAAKAAAEQGKQQLSDELRKKQEELAKKAAELKDKTDTATRLGNGSPLDKKPFDDAANKLTQDKPLDALTEQEKAARELDRLADRLADEAGKRGDAKEAATQIARWQEDLRRRAADAAKANPMGLPPAVQQKLQAEQKAIQKATDRLQLPQSDTLQEAKQDASAKAGKAADAVGKPDTDELMKKSADALQNLADKTPSNADRNKAARDELEKLRREQDALAKEAADAVKAQAEKNPDDPAARDELAKKLKDVAAKQDELAKKVKKLDTPGQEQRRDRTADAGQKAGDDLRGGLPQDIPASQADAKRQMDRLRDALDGNTPADDKAAQLARMQQQLTDELTKMEKPNADDLQRLQRRQKEINKQLAELNTPEANGEKNDARDAGQAAEAALQKPEPDVDELKKKSKAAADAAKKLADKAAGESTEDKLDRLAKNRAEQAKKAGDSRDDDPARARDAKQQLDRDLEELKNVRAGDAQAAKKKAVDALERLQRTPDPEKEKALQQEAADAAKELAEKVKKNGDRKPDQARAPQPKPDPADPEDPDNGLATEQQAKTARDLAKQQRELRDELSKKAENAGKNPPKPTENDPLGDLAKEQAEVAKQADELAKKAAGMKPDMMMPEGMKADPAAPQTGDAAKAAREAADKLEAGDPTAAGKAGEQAAEKLQDAAEKGGAEGVKAKADELAKKQADLNRRIAEAGKDPGAVAARQQRRQQELAKEAGEAADKLEKAAGRQPGGEPMGGDPLKQAAEEARKAGQQMDRAGQEAGMGKGDKAADARKQAADKLEQAAQQAGKGGGEGQPMPGGQPGEGQAAKDAAKAAQQAGDQMKQAQGELGKGQPGKPGAQQAMQKAADQLKKATEQLAKGDPMPGGGGEGGNNAGDFSKPPTKDIPSVVTDNIGKGWGDLPGDVKTKIIQELTAKYGDDYAKAIKLYFEQLADRK